MEHGKRRINIRNDMFVHTFAFPKRLTVPHLELEAVFGRKRKRDVKCPFGQDKTNWN
jgi:hypothetical protein